MVRSIFLSLNLPRIASCPLTRETLSEIHKFRGKFLTATEEPVEYQDERGRLRRCAQSRVSRYAPRAR